MFQLDKKFFVDTQAKNYCFVPLCKSNYPLRDVQLMEIIKNAFDSQDYVICKPVTYQKLFITFTDFSYIDCMNSREIKHYLYYINMFYYNGVGHSVIMHVESDKQYPQNEFSYFVLLPRYSNTGRLICRRAISFVDRKETSK